MFTETEYTYLEQLVNTYVLNGQYEYYLAYTNTDISGNYNIDTPDFIVIFSKDEITSNNNNFYITGQNLQISVDSSSANRNGQNTSRYVFTENVGSVSVPQYEFIYTNAKNSRYADLLSYRVYEESIQETQNIAYNVSKEEFYLTPLLLSLLICMLLLKWLYPMKGGKDL